jgi:enoyl-CoA hydratase/carnithine racemase
VSVDTRGVLRVDDAERIRTVTLDRPDARNAFNDAMYDAVRDALLDAQTDPGIAVVVVTGAPGAFSAGQDLAEMAKRPRYDDGERHGFPPFIEALESFDKPLVAAVNGVAVGIGLTMLAHCDLVLVGESARLRAPFVGLGITMEAGSSYTLPRRIGWQETAHLVFTGAWLDSQRAVDVGLAWRRVPDDALFDETIAVAREIAAMPVSGLVATKRVLLGAKVEGSRAARAREDAEIAALAGGPAQREALAAFREKRPADFTNL